GFFSSIMVMILTVPLGTAYTDHLTRPLISAGASWQEPHDPQQLDASKPFLVMYSDGSVTFH
ncbi:hypothetical protein, partial [Micrococcus luteus]|uniref:hypothetical protein n=1 Tax=Micrococcus luteus TaxID=1270 RepID=UPI001C2298D1